MKRKLFCEISPAAYRLSVRKNIVLRNIEDIFSRTCFANDKTKDRLPFLVYEHKSLIRRVLGNVDMVLQENKAVNLSIAAPRINGILIKPGEVFSFWHLVGNVKASKGYKEGLVISNAKVSSGIGGGMCQLTNLIHWMVLHSPLEIIEHHHHDGFDLFPDYNRQIPFGTGTSIAYNYIDYRVKNTTDKTYQLIVYVTDTHLCGQLRADAEDSIKYHIISENERFVCKDGVVFRKGEVFRNCIDKRTGDIIFHELLRENNAKVMYDTKILEISDI